MLQGPATFVLAILGCGEGEAQCQQVALAPARYESQAQCLAATEDALSRVDAPYPVLVADCRRAGTQVAVRADDVRLPEPRRPIRTASARR